MDAPATNALISEALLDSEAKLTAAFESKLDAVRAEVGAVSARVDLLANIEADLNKEFPFRAFRDSCDPDI